MNALAAAVTPRTVRRPAIRPLNPGANGVNTYFDLMDQWVTSLADAFRDAGTIAH